MRPHRSLVPRPPPFFVLRFVFSIIHGSLASFPGSRAGEEEREPGTHCSRMRQVPLVTCTLLRCTKITVNSAYLLKGHTAWLYSFWDSYGRFLSQKQYRFAGDSLHCFVRSDRWTSKEKIASVTCCSVWLESTNAWTIPACEELSALVAPSSSSTQSMVRDRHLLCGRSRHTLRRLV